MPHLYQCDVRDSRIFEKAFLRKRCFRRVMGLLAGCIFLAGCVVVVPDMPKGLTSAGSLKHVYGLAPLRVKPPYETRSYSEIRGPSTRPAGAQRDELRDERLLTDGAYRSWRWRIWATPDVAASWVRGQSGPAAYACPSKHCIPLRWKSAFVRLFQVMDYLLDEQPLPLSLRVNLIPPGIPFIKTWVTRRSQRAVPAVFTFPYPTALGTDINNQEKRERAFVHVVSIVGYELQHFEYAAHYTSGPKSSSPGIRELKDEANSTCWMLATKLALLAGRSYTLAIQLPNINTLSAVLGSVVQYKTDAIWGPALLRRDLARYLGRVAPATVGAWHVRIPMTDYPVMNQVLAYCRGFTRFSGDIARGHMPIRQVAHTRFWPVAQESRSSVK